MTPLMRAQGWKAPRHSAELVYPEGLNTSGTDDELDISLSPSPNYAALAEAAAGSALESAHDGRWMRGVRVRNVRELKAALDVARERVGEKRKGMLIEVLM